MARSAASIQAEISTIETRLQSANSMYSTIGVDATTLTATDRKNLEARLDSLYIQLDRANGTAPMLVRGRLKGLG